MIFFNIEIFILVVAFSLFFSGLFQIIFSENKNFLLIMVASEIMFLGMNLGFIYLFIFKCITGALWCYILFLVIIIGEAAIGFSLVITLLKFNNSIKLSDLRYLKL